MSPAIIASAVSGDVPTRPMTMTPRERTGLQEMFQSWGRDPAELDWNGQESASLADLAASVLPRLTRDRSLSTLILATATHDATPTSQPSVAVLREHIAHDHAIDLPAAWSITEQGMLAPLTALRVGCRRARRLSGDVVVIAADRSGLRYQARMSQYQQAFASRAVGVVLADTADAVWFGTGAYESFPGLLAQSVRAVPPPDFLVVTGDLDKDGVQGLKALERPTKHVEPGQPVVGVLAEAARWRGRALLVIADPDQELVGLGSIRVVCH